jgi:hypothetical protein
MAEPTEAQIAKARQALADSALMPSAMERAAYVAQALADEAERAVMAEREACAEIADAPQTQSSKAVARFIRARGTP